MGETKQKIKIKTLGRKFCAFFNKKKIAYLLLILALVGLAVAYFVLRPRPQYVSGSVIGPEVSAVNEEKIYPSPVSILFPSQVMRMDMVGNDVTQGISIFPNLAGRFSISNQYGVTFSPDADWAPDTTYTIKLDPKILDKIVEVKPLEYQFETPAFNAEVLDLQFYEDPTQPKIKQVTFTLSFTHPADIDSLYNNLKLQTVGGKDYGFKLTPDKHGRVVYVVSDPIKIGREEDFLNIWLKKAQNKYNQESLEKTVKAKITIPSSSTFFKLKDVSSSIVFNAEKDNRAEQILMLEFSSAVSASNLSKYIEMYQFDGYCSTFEEMLSKLKQKDVDVSAIKSAKPLQVEPLPLDAAFSKLHSFRYDLPKSENICLIAVVKRGLMSEDEFVFGKTEVRTTSHVAYPSSTKIGFEGSLMSLTGDKHLTLVTRGIEKIEACVSRIPASAVNHLISQSYGNFGQPYFRGYFDQNNIAENFCETLKLNVSHPAEINYSSVDLNQYFESRKGIFIADVKGFRKGEKYASSSDRRLVLVSNLGMIVKDNLDKTHEVYVSDFAKQKPVKNAKVEVLGKNGIPVLTAYTDAKGMAYLPPLQDYQREKEPVAYVVSFENDFSYIPIGRQDRKLDYSRFDVEGEYVGQDQEIKAYAFNDRGIYRPGETVNFGIVVRNFNLDIPVGNRLKIDIRNPNGDEILDKDMIVGKMGFLDLSYALGKTAKTGTYTMSVSVLKEQRYYQTIGSNSFVVEEFEPETMRIRSNIVGTPVKGWLTSDKIEVNVVLENLYGNPATGHEVRANFEISPAAFFFDQYSDYVFMDPSRKANINLATVKEKLEPQQTKDDGKADFEIDLTNYAKGTYRLMFYAQGMEKEGGRSVTTQASVLVSPSPYLVGYKVDGSTQYIKKDSDRFIEYIAVNPLLEKIDLADLTLELYEKEYVSTLVKQPNGTYQYQSVAKDKLITSVETEIKRDGLKYQLDTSRPGEFFVQVVDQKGEVLTKVDYMVDGAKNLTYALNRNAELKLKLNQDQYNIGDEISMQITAPYTGYGLITIEKDQVYAAKWFVADTLSSTQSIELPYGVEGNAYINVAFIRNLGSEEIFMSPFSYAVAPFAINKNNRTLKINLQTPDVVKPGETLNIEYKAQHKGQIILYGVNLGILQFAKYQTPNPLAFFMPKQALRVVTMQILDLILPDAGLLNKLRSTGGDEMSMDELGDFANPFARKVDKPVAFWSGILDVSDQPKTFSYTVPENFNGQIRVMAVGVDKQAYGAVQTPVLVRGDFAMTLSAPFNVIPGDEFEVGVSVTNMVEGSKNLKVKLDVEASDNLEILDANTQEFDLKERGETSFTYKVKALGKLGDAQIAFRVTSGEYRSKMTTHLGIRPALPFSTTIDAGYAKKEKEFKNFSLDMFKEYQNKEVYASTSPLVLAQGLVQYLDKYPYSCTEQTISRIYPLIVLLFEHPNLTKGVDVYNAYDEAMSLLKLRQEHDGGFSVWGQGNSDTFVSIYGLEFLQYAKAKGFDVPDNMLKKATEYAKQTAGQTPASLQEANNIAYAIYVLTSSGEITTNYLVNLENTLNEAYKKEWRSSLAASYMAASYKLLRDEDKAKALVGYYKTGKDNINDYRHLVVMAAHFDAEFDKIKDKSIDTLLEPLKNDRLNSLSSAWAILALNAYPYNAKVDEKIEFSAGKQGFDGFAYSEFTGLGSTVPLNIKASGAFYYVLSQQGFLKDLPASAKMQGVELYKEILDKDGKVITSAHLGDEVTVRIRIKSTKKDFVSDVAVVDLVPGCFETVGNSLEVSKGYLDSTEVKEDRVILYLTAAKEMKEISYKAKVIAKGSFVLPPVYSTALYDGAIRANTKAGRFVVE